MDDDIDDDEIDKNELDNLDNNKVLDKTERRRKK